MKNSRLKNKANKSEGRTFTVNLIRRKNKAFYTKISKETNQKSFWSAPGTLFSGTQHDKRQKDKVTLRNEVKVVSNNYTDAGHLSNNYFKILGKLKN